MQDALKAHDKGVYQGRGKGSGVRVGGKAKPNRRLVTCPNCSHVFEPPEAAAAQEPAPRLDDKGQHLVLIRHRGEDA